MKDMYKQQAVQALEFYIMNDRAQTNLKRPFDIYKEDLVFNLIGNDNNTAKAVLRLTQSDIQVAC